MAEPKKLSPMMQKKLAAEQAKAAAGATEAKADAPVETPAPKPAPAAAPKPAPAAAKPAPVTAVAKPAPKVEGASTAPKMTTGKLEKNPNGERYGYGDGLASVFGTPPAIDDAYDAVRIVSKIPATVLDGVITFFKKVTS
ncbi:MAG: hypothetical protein SNJ55_04715 [Chloroherpetonaceae bacterium]